LQNAGVCKLYRGSKSAAVFSEIRTVSNGNKTAAYAVFTVRRPIMNLNEKTMVNDTLVGINGELVRYSEMISQTENPELKQKLKQIRNQ